MKKLLTILLIFPLSAFALATTTSSITILPLQNSKYYLGTTSPSNLAWKGIITNQLCLTADVCRTSWPSGGLSIYDAWTHPIAGTSATTSNIQITGSSTLQNFTFRNATGTNATTTNFFSTTASSTNLFAGVFNGAGLVACSSAGNALIWTGGTFGCNTGYLTSAVTSFAQTYGSAQTGAITVATSTTAINNDWGITNAGGTTFTFNIPTATTAIRGLLSGTDFTTFNNKQATVSATYPVQISANVVSLAFGTTTDNNWSGKNVFQNASSTFVGSLTIGGNATATNATTSSLFVSGNASTTHLFGTDINGFGLSTCTGASQSLHWSGGVLSCVTLSGFASSTLLTNDNGFTGLNTFSDITSILRSTTTNATSTNFFATTASTTNLFFSTANGGAITSSGLGTFQNILSLGSTTLQNFTALNSTSSNATTTNFYTTTASTTNLFFTTANGGALTLTGIATVQNLLVNSSSTLQNFTALQSTSTNATTTNFFATNASTTNLSGTSVTGFGLTSCTGGTNALRWSGGSFSCASNTDNTSSTTLLSDNNGFTGLNTFTDLKLVTRATTTNSTTTNAYFSGNTTLAGTLFDSTLLAGTAGNILMTTGTGIQWVASSTLSNATAYKQASNYATVAALPANNYANGTGGVGATITEIGFGALSVDGASPTAGQRILVKNEGTAANNGIYTVTAAGSGIAAFVLTRATDFNNSLDIYPGVATYIVSGATLDDTTWVMTSDSPITVGTTALNFSELGVGGSSFTAGSVLFSDGSKITQDNASFSFDDTLNKLTVTNLAGTTATVTSATTTNLNVSGFGTIATASTTSFFGSGLTSCTGSSQSLHWAAGAFSCGSVSAGAASSTLLTDNNGFTGLNTFSDLASVLRSTTTQATSTNLYTSSNTNLAVTSGKVGVGTTSPNETLGIFTSASGGIQVVSNNSAWLRLYSDQLFNSNRNQWYIGQLTTGQFFIATSTTAASRVVTVSDISGNFGIKTASPNYPLEVTGTAGATSFLATSSSTLQDFTASNATSTSATTTNFFSTTASSTNLFGSFLDFDNHSLYVDNANHRVGVGTSTPTDLLSVYSGSIMQAPSAPVYKGGIDETGSLTGTGNIAVNQAVVVGRYMYVAAANTAGGACATGAGNATGCNFQIYDVSTSTPTFLGGASADGTTNGGNSLTAFTALAVKGNYAYVLMNGSTTACSQVAGNNAGNGCELKVFDVSSPTNPKYVGGADSTGTANSGTGSANMAAIIIQGRYAYILKGASATACSATLATGCELSIFDISSSTAPVFVGGGDASGTTNGGTTNSATNAIAVSGKYAYVTKVGIAGTACSQVPGSASGCAFQIWDISNPYAPTYMSGAASNGLVNSGDSATNFNAVAIQNNYAYVGMAGSTTACTLVPAAAGNGCETQIFNVASSSAPVYVAGIDAGGALNSGVQSDGNLWLFPAGRYLYDGYNSNSTICSQVAGSAVGCEFKVFDISNPYSPYYVGGVDANGSATGNGSNGANSVQVVGRNAYVSFASSGSACSQTVGSAIGCELKIFDVSGADFTSLYAGTIETGGLQVLGDFMAQGTVNLNSLNVGFGGIFSNGPLSVYIASSTASTRVSASFMGGNVGIGTTNPAALLDIFGLASTTNLIVQASTTLQNFTGLMATATNATTTNFFSTTASSTNLFSTGFFTGSIQASGLVGLGTTTPFATLSVVGDGVNPIFAVATSSSVLNSTDHVFAINNIGHILTNGPIPTVGTGTTCGSGPTLAASSNDSDGKITVGTGTPKYCLLTFATAWVHAPVCTVTGAPPAGQVAPTFLASSTITRLGIAVAATSTMANAPPMPSFILMYHCEGTGVQ